MLIGWSPAGGSSVNVSGGVLNLTGDGSDFVVGYGAAASMNITGGTVNLNRSLAFNNSSTLSLSGTGLVNIDSGGMMNASPVIHGGGTLRFNGGGGNSANNLSVYDGTVDLNGQNLPSGTWGNFLPRANGNRILNSSSSAATIADGNRGCMEQAWPIPRQAMACPDHRRWRTRRRRNAGCRGSGSAPGAAGCR